nr:RING-box protein 1 [Ipomoea trifida]
MQILWWITVLFVGTISWISVSSAKLIKLVPQVRNAQLLGGFVTMPSTSIALADGSRLVKSAPWTTASGSSRSTGTRGILCQIELWGVVGFWLSAAVTRTENSSYHPIYRIPYSFLLQIVQSRTAVSV